jgi:hypothetical protein
MSSNTLLLPDTLIAPSTLLSIVTKGGEMFNEYRVIYLDDGIHCVIIGDNTGRIVSSEYEIWKPIDRDGDCAKGFDSTGHSMPCLSILFDC